MVRGTARGFGLVGVAGAMFGAAAASVARSGRDVSAVVLAADAAHLWAQVRGALGAADRPAPSLAEVGSVAAGSVGEVGSVAAGSLVAGQGLSLVHFSAQPQPVLSLILPNVSLKMCLC